MENMERVTQGVSAMPSVAEHLRTSFRKAQSNRAPKHVKVPGYDGLYLKFRPLDSYEEVAETIKATIKRNPHISATQRDVAVGVETMLLASVGSYAIVDGETYDIGLTLGLQLYNYIFPPETDEEGHPIPGPSTDQEAVYLLFIDDLSLMNVATMLDMWWKNAGVETEDELLGN